MTTQKKKPSTKSKSVSEPATATKTVKPSKKAMAQANNTPAAEAPVAPAMAATLAQAPTVSHQAPAVAASEPKDEAPVANAEAVQAASQPVLTIGMFQKRLHEKGCYGGHWDGHYGPLTKAAVRKFQALQGLPVDGEPTPETLAALGF